MSQAKRIGAESEGATPSPTPPPAAPAPAPPKPSASNAPGLNELLGKLSTPVEAVEMPEHLRSWQEETQDDAPPYSEAEAQEAGITQDVIADYGDMAKMYIGMFDSAVGGIGSLYTGNNPENYQKFAKSPPPDYYVNATAAVIAKYQATMGPEALLLSAILAIYHPVGIKIYQDRKKAIDADAKKK